MASGIFRLTAAVCRSMIIANTGGSLALLLIFLLGGFIIPRGWYKNKALKPDAKVVKINSIRATIPV